MSNDEIMARISWDISNAEEAMGQTMNDYISRKAAIANSREYNLGGSYDNTERAVPVDTINAIPAADVLPVVTCEECVWHVDDGCHSCTKLGMLCPDDADFYCKYGRRPNCGADMREES